MRVYPVIFQVNTKALNEKGKAISLRPSGQDSEPNLVTLPRSDERRMPLQIAIFTWQEFFTKSESSPPVSALISDLLVPLFWLARIHLSLCSCPETCCHTLARLRPSNVLQQCEQ